MLKKVYLLQKCTQLHFVNVTYFMNNNCTFRKEQYLENEHIPYPVYAKNNVFFSKISNKKNSFFNNIVIIIQSAYIIHIYLGNRCVGLPQTTLYLLCTQLTKILKFVGQCFANFDRVHCWMDSSFLYGRMSIALF